MKRHPRARFVLACTLPLFACASPEAVERAQAALTVDECMESVVDGEVAICHRTFESPPYARIAVKENACVKAHANGTCQDLCAGALDGTPCDDRNACSRNDACKAGACAGESYTPEGSCNGAGTCSLTLDGDCALDAPIVIDAASNLKSIDCQDHHLSARELAILLDAATGVTIQHCTISAPFGIFAIQGGLHKIKHNTITSDNTAISLYSVDDTSIDRNTIVADCNGIWVGRDSQRNKIKGNNITTNATGATISAQRAPGPLGASNPKVPTTVGIFVGRGPGPFSTLFDVVVGHKLYQIETPPTLTSGPDDSPTDTLIEDNDIAGSIKTPGIELSSAQGTVIRHNRVTPSMAGVVLGAVDDRSKDKKFPEKCSLDWTRHCLEDADCNILAVDDADGNGQVDPSSESKGTCPTITPVQVTWRSNDTFIENNVISSPFVWGMQIASPTTTVRYNQITGPVYPGDYAAAGGGVGFEIRKGALDSGVFTHNKVDDVPAALRLFRPTMGATTMGAIIIMNDFTGWTDEVVTATDGSTPYSMTSELSHEERGNYWGLACSNAFACDKRIALGTLTVSSTGVITIDGTAETDVVDSYPYGVPVADLDGASLPATCPATCPAP